MDVHRGGNSTRDDVIVLEHVRKEFGTFVAVERADFTIGRGEFFSLLGPSGCGKTTLLKMIAGFEQPTSGRILLEGDDVGGTPPHKRNVNTVFQQYALFPHMSVLDNVAFGLRSKKVAPAQARSRAQEMLDVVRLGEFSHRRSGQLSGGQQQRVALARALVNLPSALLLDEPLAALDLKLREAMQIELKRIQREVDITFIFVTHDQGEALTMSDRMAVMSRGRVEQIGTPSEIYDTPASIFVAGFIGSANLLPGTLDRNGDGMVAVLDSGDRVSVNGDTEARAGDPVTVMIRPERLQAAGPVEDGRAVRATVKDLIFQGSTVRLIADALGGTEVVATIDSDDELPPLRPGDEVTLTWSPDAAFLLRGRSEVVGATTTDVDEVQAALDGKDVSEAVATPSDPDRSRLNRRALLIGGGVVAAGAIGALVLSGAGDSSGGGGDEEAGGAGAGGGVGQGADQVRILNWTEYIDPDEPGAPGTAARFEDETGISVQYSEGFNDNNQVYGTEFEPYLGNGQPANYDIICPTYWMAARIKQRDWLAPLPFNLIPNYSNLDTTYLDLDWDRGAKYHLPWQAGITGIAYNESVTGRELRSFSDLLDPEFEGQVAFFTEMRDTLGLMMLSQGNDPATADQDTIGQALDAIEEATQSGQVRAFTGNDYLQSIDNGNFAACIAWSGDIAQSENPDVHFVVPEEGGMSWFDTMVIPAGSPNGVAAAEWMNFVYDPVNAAKITAWVQYVSPVIGVRDELVKMGGDAAALAENPLLFPTDEDRRRLFVFADMPAELDAETTERFAGISGA